MNQHQRRIDVRRQRKRRTEDTFCHIMIAKAIAPRATKAGARPAARHRAAPPRARAERTRRAAFFEPTSDFCTRGMMVSDARDGEIEIAEKPRP